MGCRLCRSTHLRINNYVVFLLAYVFFCLSGQGWALAAGPEGNEDPAVVQDSVIPSETTPLVAGRVHFVSGQVQAINEAGGMRTLQKDDSVHAGDTVITAQQSSVQIMMGDGGLFALSADTQFKLDSFKFSDEEDGTENSFFTLNKGRLRTVTGLIGRSDRQSYRITTPAAVIGINGTDHEIVYRPVDTAGVLAGTYNKVNSGATSLTTDLGTVSVAPGQMGYSGSMREMPQILPINTSLFEGILDDTAGSFVPSMAIQSQEEMMDEVVAPDDSEQTSEAIQSAKPAVIEEPRVEPAQATFVRAPIAWGGDVSESLRRQKLQPGQSSMQHVQAVNLRAATYIWQPWLAQVSGGVGVVNAKTVYGTNTNDKLGLNGRGALSLVPYSRFPFSASYYLNDNRSGTGTYAPVTDVQSNSTGFALQQRYRPESGVSSSVASYNRDRTRLQRITATGDIDKLNSRLHLQHDYHLPGSPSRYGVGYDRRTSSAGVTGIGIFTGLKVNYSTRFKQQTVDLSSLNTQNEYAEESLHFNSVSLRHAYRPDALFSVTTSAIASQSKSLSLSSGSADIGNLQFDSSSSWQPDEELPFYVFGSLRIFDSSYDSGAASITSQSRLASASVSYNASANMVYGLRETIAQTRSDTSSSVTTLTGVNAAYTSDYTKVGKATYNWTANGALDYQTDSAADSNWIVLAGAGHGLRLPYTLDKGELDFNVHQSLVVKNDAIFGQNTTLSHTGGVTWRTIVGDSTSGAMSFSVGDIHTYGATPTHLQTANFGTNIQHKASAYSSLAALTSITWSGNERGQTTTSAKADLRYHHIRAFNVKGLRYTFIFNVNKYQFDDVGVIEKSRDGYLIDQKLEYAIGRAYLRLNGSVAKNANTTTTLVVLQIGRSFGEI